MGALLTAAALGVGCASAPALPPAAATNSRSPEDDPGVTRVLDESEQQEVERALRSVAAGHVPVDPPQAASPGVRLSDVPDAVRLACGEKGIEMAVVERDRDDLGYRFRLKTIEDWPATLRVWRGPGGDIEAAATVGRFDDHPERARALEERVKHYLHVLARKRKLPEGSD